MSEQQKQWVRIFIVSIFAFVGALLGNWIANLMPNLFVGFTWAAGAAIAGVGTFVLLSGLNLVSGGKITV